MTKATQAIHHQRIRDMRKKHKEMLKDVPILKRRRIKRILDL